MPVPTGEKKPLITIITVVYNDSLHLEETILSVLDLGYGNTAYIIVDGGSTDETVDLIKKYEARLFWWISEPDRGIYDAMNKGWAAASDDGYVLFLGAGDRIISLPDGMESFGPRDVLYGDVQLADRLFVGRAGFALSCNNTLHHQALLVRKSLHPEPPFDTTFKVYADFDFNQRLMKSRVSFVHIPEFRAFASPDGLSSRKAHLETLRIVRKNFGLFRCGIASLFMLLQKVARTLGAVR